ncbi:MAG TPA: response regulator [Syntrophobacteria bacterium]|nr:response regulator [Syntrophobacteria bacterium]
MADTVLVVDDEEYVRELLKTFLTEMGYQVIVASHGEEALDLAKKESLQVIILDVKMPGIDGIETCRRLKSDGGTCVIPVIVATALRETLPAVLDAGANDFVTKPFHLTELLTRIRSILRVKHLTDELERACAYIKELEKELPRH